MEPNYVGHNGRIDAMAAAWLLDEDHIFFLDNEITWDGRRHGFVGAQVNVGNMDEVPLFMSNYETLMNGVLDLMMMLEDDEALRVPREAINPSLHEAIREGDLTGITLFNLIACGHAIKILNTRGDAYQVIYDNRLARGIPAFYKLVLRMIWDMREYNGIGGPFQAVFASARNIDADQYLRDFNGAVPGAVSEAMWVEQVDGAPVVELPAESEIADYVEEAVRGFASGFDAPMDMQADEELFETCLSSVANEFPKTIAIEGTHVLGRASRIENIKVGDPLVLAADWRSRYFDPVCIEVFNTDGETLGNLNEQFTPAMSGNRELACLLPYITATVESVTPLSQRRKGSKYALMDVRLDLDASILDEGLWAPHVCQPVVNQAKKLLALPAAERVVLSKGALVASDLKGNVATGKAKDAPNPVGSVYKKPDAPTAVNEGGDATPEDVDLGGILAGLTGALDDLMSTAADALGVSREELDDMTESGSFGGRILAEPFDSAAIPRIEKALNEKVSASYFIETSEIVAGALMSARQSACDSATSSWNSDEDNVAAMAREFAKFNEVICRHYGYFVDALEAQVALGNDPGEIGRMATEVGEFSELVADRFSCGDAYLDGVANSRSPVKRPAEYDRIHARWQKVNAR